MHTRVAGSRTARSRLGNCAKRRKLIIARRHMPRRKIQTDFAYEPCIGQEPQHAIHLGMCDSSISRNAPRMQAQPQRNVGRQTRMTKPHILIRRFRHAEKVLVRVRLRIRAKTRVMLKVAMSIKLHEVKPHRAELHRARLRRSPLRSVETRKPLFPAHARPFPYSTVPLRSIMHCHVQFRCVDVVGRPRLATPTLRWPH